MSQTSNNKWSKSFDKTATSPSHMDGSTVFARSSQCAPLCSWTHPSTYSKGHLNRFSHFWTAYSRESLYFVMGHLSKSPIRMGDLDSHLIHGSIGPPPKWHLDQFSLFCRAHNHHRQANRPCYSVCNNRPHLHMQYCNVA